MNKTLAYKVEKYGEIVLLVLVGYYFNFHLKPEYVDFKEIIKDVPILSFSIFGFLLTLLTIIIQGDSETVEWMKQKKNLFNRFIGLNRKIVFLSFIVGIFSLLFRLLEKSNIEVNTEVFLLSLLFSVTIILLLNVIYFLTLFYLLIKK